MARTSDRFTSILLIAALAPSLSAEDPPASTPSPKNDYDAALQLEPKALANLVPTQVGLRHCRCPACGADDRLEPLRWNLADPDHLTCRLCAAKLPNDTIPAKVNNAVPELLVETAPGRTRRYPYHVLSPDQRRYPDERAYLTARRDDQAARSLARLCLELATRWSSAPAAERDPQLALRSACLLLRFAQVVPDWGLRYDPPGHPPFFHPANLRPPYRPGYQTGHWDRLASRSVPLELLAAYERLQSDPSLLAAGLMLGIANPDATLRAFFLDQAAFIARQPDYPGVETLEACRRLYAVGRVLGHSPATIEADRRLELLHRTLFFADGLNRDRDHALQRALVERFARCASERLGGPPAWLPEWVASAGRLANLVENAPLDPPVQLAGLDRQPPAPALDSILLPEAGWCQLRGAGASSLTVDLGTPRASDPARLGPPALIRGLGVPFLSISAQPSSEPSTDPRPAASRATPARPVYFAHEADLQVAAFAESDPASAGLDRLRHVVVRLDDPEQGPLAISVLELLGPTPHQLKLRPIDPTLAWEAPPAPIPTSGPTLWSLVAPSGNRLRIHTLGPDENRRILSTRASTDTPASPPSLLIQHRPESDPVARSVFVHALEPVPAGATPRRRVGRVGSDDNAILVWTSTGPSADALLINLHPGQSASATLPDGRTLATDGLVAIARPDSLLLAGGTFATCGASRVEHERLELPLLDAQPGFATVEGTWPPSEVVGQTVFFDHADGATRAAVVRAVEPLGPKSTRLLFAEPLAFRIDPETQRAVDLAWPLASHPGPHRARIARISRVDFRPAAP